MSNGAIAIVAGAVLLLVALIGGGFSIHGGTTIPRIPRVPRIGIGALGLALLAFGGFLVLPESVGQQSANGAQPSTQSSPTSSSSTTDPTSTGPRPIEPVTSADVSFSSPSQGMELRYGHDVTVTVNVSGLGPGHAIWLFAVPETDPSTLYFTEDAPYTVSNGSRSHTDKQVGDSTDNGKTISYVAYEADANCSTTLKQIALGPGDPPRIALPNDCLVNQRARVDMNVI